MNDNKTIYKDSIESESPTIVETDTNSKNGQNKCPKCGATDISLNVNNGHLRCNFCRFEFEPEKVTGFEDNLNNLEGIIIGSGASDIDEDTDEILTFKCSSCGSEVVIDTSEKTQAVCHWCRNILSVNQQIPNGSIPDVVLPFKTKKDEAEAKIIKFIRKRRFFANPSFKKEFTTDNIMGVYLPYMLVDINAHANFIGQGEHLVRKYSRGQDNNKKTYYDADLFNVKREFDITINDMSIETKSDLLDNQSSKTNNIINSIMPFDTENCVKWNANYLKGYTSEKRDMNMDQLKNIVEIQSKDIARISCNSTLKHYDRGVRWDSEQIYIKGQQWQSAYLPIWLYSYLEDKGDKKILHYVAVNARTNETMGSIPIYISKLILVSSIVEIIGLFAMLFVDSDLSWIFALLGFIYFIFIYLRYRNLGARHLYEKETEINVSNMEKTDNFVEHRKGLRNSSMSNANNNRLDGTNTFNNFLNSIGNMNSISNIVDKFSKK